MADIDIMNEDIRFLLRNMDYQKALEKIREWERKDEFDPEALSGELLLAISRAYYFSKEYERSREYLYVFEDNYPYMCLGIEYIELKDKLLILEDKAEQAIELLITAIDKYENENEKYWLNFYLGKAYFWNGEYREANRHFRKCYTYYLEAGDDYMLGLTIYMMGYHAFQRNMFDQAESYFEEALSSFKKAKRAKQMGNCYNLLGIIKYRTGNYEESKKYLDLARVKYQFCSSINNVLNCRIAGARVEMFRGDYDLSEGILKETYREAGKLNYGRARALSAEFLGEICYRRERYEEAEKWLTEALELAKQTAPRGDVAAEVFRRLGDVQIELGKLAEAEATLAEAEKLCKHLDDKYELGSVFRARAVLAIRRGNLETARSWIDESVILHRTINERFELGCTYMKGAAEYLRLVGEETATSVLTSDLISDAGSFAVEAIHLFSELGLEERVRSCRELLTGVDRLSGERKKRRKVELQFKDSWLQAGIFVARSAEMKEALEEMKRYSDKDISVLLTGETGTGKEMAARYIHRIGGRAGRPFIAVNCAAIPPEVFESEFFGHRRGAFTGAVSDREGLIEKANGGVLFLDEITELSKRSQAKLLRVLDDGTVRRMGSCEERQVDFKIISASNRDINRMIEQGKLRKDLYYRISGREIHLIPLRERREDIEPLLSYYLDSREIGIELEAMDLLSRYPWPGNVRELVNMVAGMESVERGGLIRLEDLPGKILNASYGETGRMKRSEQVGFKQSGPEKKRELITEALKRSSGNRAAAARELGIARMTLYRYLEQFSIF